MKILKLINHLFDNIYKATVVGNELNKAYPTYSKGVKETLDKAKERIAEKLPHYLADREAEINERVRFKLDQILKVTENTLERLRFAQYDERFKKEVYKEVLDLVRKERDLDVPHDNMKLSARLIMEDKLIHSLQRKYIKRGEPNYFNRCTSLAGEILNTKLFSVDKCWVSLEEKKPEIGQNVLIVTPEYDYPITATFGEKGRFYNAPICDFTAVTHWMELPTKPRK